MDLLVKNKSIIFVKAEVTEGVYAAPTSADDALEVLSSGAELSMKRDLIDRSVLTDTIEEVASRVGMKNVTGNIPVEFKAGKIAGGLPRESVLYESVLGGKISATSSITKAGNTTTSLKIEDADISKYKKHCLVLIKEPGKFEVRPVSVVISTGGNASLTLAIPLAEAPSDNVVIEAFSTFFHDSNYLPFSTSYYAGSEIKEAGLGCKGVSASLENWETGKIPSWKFAISGLDMTQDVEAPAFTLDFSTDAKAPTMFLAQAWINQEAVDYNKIGLTITNEKTDVLSAARLSGKMASKKTKLTVEGTIDPYKSNLDVARFNSYNNNQEISIFAYGFYDDGSVEGEFKNVVAIYIPQAKITELTEGEKSGVISEEIKFKSFKKLGKDTIFLGFI